MCSIVPSLYNKIKDIMIEYQGVESYSKLCVSKIDEMFREEVKANIEKMDNKLRVCLINAMVEFAIEKEHRDFCADLSDITEKHFDILKAELLKEE